MNLKTTKIPFDVDKWQALQNQINIFDKIEFSNISKKAIKEKLHDLRTRQVPNRDVLLNSTDEEITFYWFKN